MDKRGRRDFQHVRVPTHFNRISYDPFPVCIRTLQAWRRGWRFAKSGQHNWGIFRQFDILDVTTHVLHSEFERLFLTGSGIAE